MKKASGSSHVRNLRKRVLDVLAELYIFPQTSRSVTRALAKQIDRVDTRKVRDSFTYLEKKKYVTTVRRKDGRITAAITAQGVDLVEGAAEDRGVLPANPDKSGLNLNRDIRAGALSYCRQFPESFNGDDEILAELRELGMTSLVIDQVASQIWYLADKGYLEMKTVAMKSGVVSLARITALGMDLVDGVISDPGVACDE